MSEPVPTSSKTLAGLKIDRSATPARVRRKRWLWPVLGLVAAGVALALALAPKVHSVQAVAVVSTTGTQQYAMLTASGYVVAQRRAAVASKASGRLVELKVREGSVVKAGEVIARLDNADVQAALATTAAGVRAAEAALKLADAGLRGAEASINQAAAAQAQAAAELKRALALQAQSFVSPQAVDAAKARADGAAAALAAAEAGRAQAQAQAAQAQAQLAMAQAQVRVQQVNEDFTLIRAPFDGVVLVKNANVGDMVTPFSSAAGSQGAVVTMADMGTLEVEADVAEANVGKLKLDAPVEITLDAFAGERWRGSVARIVPTVDRAKATVMTKVRFEKLDARILPEMSAKVQFLSQAPSEADLKPVLAINPKAVVAHEGGKRVFRIEGEVVKAVPVTTGKALGELVELVGSPLKSGDKLVLSPDPKLADGARVTVAAK